MSVKESGSGNTDHRIRPVARIHTDFPTKFGIPRQSGLTGDLESRIVFEPEFSNPDAVRGIEEFSHLWLIWEFSENVRDPKKWSPTVRPPRLGGHESRRVCDEIFVSPEFPGALRGSLKGGGNRGERNAGPCGDRGGYDGWDAGL